MAIPPTTPGSDFDAKNRACVAWTRSVLKIESGWPADIRRARNIGDFRRWKNHDTYQKSFDRLLRDLKAEKSADHDVPTPRTSQRKKLQ